MTTRIFKKKKRKKFHFFPIANIPRVVKSGFWSKTRGHGGCYYRSNRIERKSYVNIKGKQTVNIEA